MNTGKKLYGGRYVGFMFILGLGCSVISLAEVSLPILLGALGLTLFCLIQGVRHTRLENRAQGESWGRREGLGMGLFFYGLIGVCSLGICLVWSAFGDSDRMVATLIVSGAGVALAAIDLFFAELIETNPST